MPSVGDDFAFNSIFSLSTSRTVYCVNPSEFIAAYYRILNEYQGGAYRAANSAGQPQSTTNLFRPGGRYVIYSTKSGNQLTTFFTGITPLEWNRLQKVDAIIFGHDKFAYEMVHFVAASSDKEGQQSKSRDLFSVWEENFVRGLESLLVECAVIHDDIERDCFVSRVYCWFSEKLLERRDVPRAESVRTMDLRNSVVQFAGEDSHLTRALDNYSGGPLSPHRTYLQNSFDASAMPIDPLDAKDNHMSDEPIHLPPIVNKGQTIASRMPLYVKHSQPAILRSQSLAKLIAQAPILPKTPGADDNYGLLYSQPETEAEKNMNELWLARRRQEVRRP